MGNRTAIRPNGNATNENDFDLIKSVVVGPDQLLITTAAPDDPGSGNVANEEIKIAWSPQKRNSTTAVECEGGPQCEFNETLIQSVVRTHVWIQALREGKYQSIQELAEADGLHPKVIRQALRLAFLSPDLTSAILQGQQPVQLSLARIPKLLPLSWSGHRPLLG